MKSSVTSDVKQYLVEHNSECRLQNYKVVCNARTALTKKTIEPSGLLSPATSVFSGAITFVPFHYFMCSTMALHI